MEHPAAWTGNATQVLEFTESAVLTSGRLEPVLSDVVAQGLTVAGEPTWLRRVLRTRERAAVRVASPHAHNQSRAGKLFRSGRPGAKSISILAAGVGFGDVTTVACGLNATRVAEPPKARR